MDEKQIERVRKKLADMHLGLFEHITAFDTDPMPKGNYCLQDGFGTGLNTKPPRKTAKNYTQIMQQLCTLKSYISHYERIPTDNFLNTFDNFDETGNEKNVYTVKEFLAANSPLKALWIYGKTGIGKSHLLQAMIYSRLEMGVEKMFETLSPDKYHDQEIYGGKNRKGEYSSEQNPNLLYINYMHDIICETHHKDSRADFKREFGDDNERTIYFLDDVCEIEANNILTSLIDMYDKKQGRTAITSNYSLSEWLGKFSSGRSIEGIKGRLGTFVKEIQLSGDSKRKKSMVNHYLNNFIKSLHNLII